MNQRIVLLADESALFVLGGLDQWVRLQRTLAEAVRQTSPAGNVPDVTVLWRTPDLLASRAVLGPERAQDLRIEHRLAADATPFDSSGDVLLLTTRAVFRRGELGRLLRTHGSATGLLAVVPAADLAAAMAQPDAWDRLVGFLGWPGAARTPDDAPGSAWLLQREADIPVVERELFSSLGKPSDGLVSRSLNRPISRRLSRLLINTSVTPNQISLVVLAVLAASTWELSRGSAGGFVIGMLLFHLASVLDGCDGEIARAKFLESRLGAWLDTSVDLLGNHLLALALGIGLSRQPGLGQAAREGYLLEGVLTTVGIALGLWGVSRYTRSTSGAAHFNDFSASVVARAGAEGTLRRALDLGIQILRRDTYALIFVVLAVLRRPEWILHCLAAGVAIHLPVIAWSWWKTPRVSGSLNL